MVVGSKQRQKEQDETKRQVPVAPPVVLEVNVGCALVVDFS